MKFGRVRFSSAGIAVAAVFIGAVIAGCSGGGSHTAIPASSGSSAQNAAGTGSSAGQGTLAVTVTLPGGQALASSTQRSPQYVSGGTNGVYITGTCLVGGGTVTQSCTGAAFPAVYADVSGTSPLCTGSPTRTCTLSANPVPGFHYAVTVAAVDAKPTAEAASGYGTGFPTTANMLSVGSQPNAMPAATGSPGPSPTPTALGPAINTGGTTNISVGLNAIATQFVQVDLASGFPGGDTTSIKALPRVQVEPMGQTNGVLLALSAGDNANALIAGLNCTKTYPGEVGTGPGSTITGFPTSFPTPGTQVVGSQCDSFAGPDGKQYALELTSSAPTHLSVSGSANSFLTGDGAPLWGAVGGIWTQDPDGMLSPPQFAWDGVAANDTCTAPFTPTTKCGVPIPISMTNNIPTTAVPLVGKTSTYNVTNATQFLLAPFVTALSCGSNTGCSTTNTPPNCIGACPTVYLNAGGTATATVYLYGSGGETNFASNLGCYATPTTAPCLAVAATGLTTTTGCYSGMNFFSGLLNTGGSTPGQVGCVDVSDPGGSATGQNPNPTANAIDCQQTLSSTTYASLSSPPSNPVVAYIIPGTFTKGSITAGSLQADSMTFTIKANAPSGAFTGNTGYCAFQLKPTTIGQSTYLPSGNAWAAYTVAIPYTLPNFYSPVITVAVSQNNATLPIPPSNPFP